MSNLFVHAKTSGKREGNVEGRASGRVWSQVKSQMASMSTNPGPSWFPDIHFFPSLRKEVSIMENEFVISIIASGRCFARTEGVHLVPV